MYRTWEHGVGWVEYLTKEDIKPLAKSIFRHVKKDINEAIRSLENKRLDSLNTPGSDSVECNKPTVSEDRFNTVSMRSTTYRVTDNLTNKTYVATVCDDLIDDCEINEFGVFDPAEIIDEQTKIMIKNVVKSYMKDQDKDTQTC